MELLSPAGNIEKLRYAYAYGADAAYIGIKNFSLRAKADNFHATEYSEIENLKQGKKLYGALNIYFHQHDIKTLFADLDYIARYPLDGFIISDIGLIPHLKSRFPEVPLHLSTQANCTNAEAAKMYRDLGFKRIILGREVHLRDIATIKREVPDVEIEVFVHGAMCLAYSGRCFLSSYMADRSANQGTCSHPCRWRYRLLEEEKRPGEYYPVIENDGFTTILSSKDLCMIDHLDALRDAGVDAIKIEGRMKSLYYTALVTRAYRKALDVLEHGQGELIEPYKQELYKVSHREFTTGFYFEDNNVHHPTLDSYIREYQFLGTIGEPVSDGYYKVTVRNRIFRDDVIEYIGPDILYREDHSFELYNEKGEPLEVVHHGMPCYLKTEVPIKPGYIIRKKVTL